MKLDIGCGKNKKGPDWHGVDQYAMDGVDTVMDVRQKWPWEDASVDEVHCSHFLEHLEAGERVKFFNELHRVLKPGAKATIICPHWASGRAYGDPTHKWPPVSGMMAHYLSASWRETQAPHTDARWNPDGYSCDFDHVGGYSLHQSLLVKNPETVQWMMQFAIEATPDIHFTLTKR